ncbi:branched-chain amino acid ABC transporter permease [Roseateles cavernae]|uniref:branched-chain amino acid ABC transporter permease n=1 Tax=Roseateles cavernae TaxID=3153578 RepID=UPI0032E3781A
MPKHNALAYLLAAIALLLAPLLLQQLGSGPVRIVDQALLYVLLALGMNIVVGYAGLLDLGYVAFYAVGAYVFALLASPHLVEQFAAVRALFPAGLHGPWWLLIALGAGLAGLVGVLLGAPTLRLHGDYLAIVTLAFGEIIRLFIVNMRQPLNLTNGAHGISQIDDIHFFGLDLGEPLELMGLVLPPVTLYYYLFLTLVIIGIVICHRLEHSRIGRAWRAIREDETAAKAMGIDTRRLKLMAFGMGAAFGGVAGTLFAAFQGYVSPESFSMQESVLIVAMVVIGGSGHVPGVILGALLLSALPEVLRYVVGPLQAMTDGRLDAPILRQLMVALAMIATMLLRPRGLWAAHEHGSEASAPQPTAPIARPLTSSGR